MQTEYDYSVVRPTVDKQKLREMMGLIKGVPTPVIHKPTLYLRRINTKTNNIQNVYGNNIAAWRTQAASSLRPSPGETANKRRRESEKKASLRELGKMVRGY